MYTSRRALRRCILTMLLLAAGACTRLQPATTSPATTRPECVLPAPAAHISVSDAAPHEEHLVYELADAPSLWIPPTSAPERDAYAADVAARLGGPPDARRLLELQRSVYETSAPEEAASSAAVLAGAGVIAPASCLETLLWTEQARRFPMLAHPTEMGAFILRKPGHVRVYFSTMNRNGQKIRGEVTQRVREDVEAGFVLVAHLHNHPFMFDRAVGDRLHTTQISVADIGGALAPSANDLQFFMAARADLGLEAAWITNGIDTLRVPATELEELRAENGTAERGNGGTAERRNGGTGDRFMGHNPAD